MAALEVAVPDVQQARTAGAPATGQRWLQVLPHLDPVYGGLCAVVPRLARQLAEYEAMDVRLAAFCSPDEAAFVHERRSEQTSIWPLSRSPWMFDADLKQRFRAAVAESDGLHIHGLWESSTLVAASAARKFGIPYLLSAHGMLERWALANKRMKKSVYAALFEHRNVAGAACLHALTRAEADDYRRFGCKGSIAVIPNGVEAQTDADPALFLEAFPQVAGKRLVLFLGRIHYKKGVALLVQAWAGVARQCPDALLVLAGPDSEGTLATVVETIQRFDLQDRVLLTGMLDASMKWSALAASTCFVLPSYSEGLSVAALEALSMGVPAILSHECNLPEVAQRGAGWLVQTEISSVEQALHAVLACSTEELSTVRQHARTLAEREFSWKRVGERMAAVYRWVSGGPKPEGVDLQEAL